MRERPKLVPFANGRQIEAAKAAAAGQQSASQAKPNAQQATADAGRRRHDETNVTAIPAHEMTVAVRAALNSLQAELSALRAERARLVDQLKQVESLADHDALANVLNRRAFLRELDRVIAFSARFGVAAAVIYFDLNGFKQINDRHGHQAGDAIIRHVAQTLARNVRDSDIVGRVGGDEFAVILTKADAQGAQRKAQELANTLAHTALRFGRHNLRVGAAAGVTGFEPGDNALSVLARADQHMYADKARMRVQSL